MNLSSLSFVAFNFEPRKFFTCGHCDPRVHRVEVEDLHFDGRTVRIITLQVFIQFEVWLRLLTPALLEPLDDLLALKLI